MPDINYRERNRQRLHALLPSKHYAAMRWLDECFDNGIEFNVADVYRPQEKQYELLANGRTKEDVQRLAQYGYIKVSSIDKVLKYVSPQRSKLNIVSWTDESMHEKRLACDIYMIKGTHKDVERIAKKYGITHPLAGDPPHYEFDQAIESPTLYISAEAKIKAIKRGIERATVRGLDNARRLLENTLERLTKRL